MTVGIEIKKIIEAKFSGHNANPVYPVMCLNLFLIGGDFFFFVAEANRVLHVEPKEIKFRRYCIHAVDFAVREAGNTFRVAQTTARGNLGIDIRFGVAQDLGSGKNGRGKGCFHFAVCR